MKRNVAIIALCGALGASTACRHGGAPRGDVAAPVIPAGFAEENGNGWRLAMPSAWQRAAESTPSVWLAVDPQPVDDYRANVSVVTEPFPGESHDYARASEALLRHQPGASVETAQEAVLDGDPTLIVEARWSAKPPTPPVEYRTMQAHLASRGTGYVITCSVAVTAFERFRSTCDAIVKSLAVER
jgi:hypothetical protein